jgi:transcriptional regulator GlxA family with amidase domain
MHVVLYLPPSFYSGVASSMVEMLQVVNEVRGTEVFTFEFVSRHLRSQSRSGILFRARAWPSRKLDVLIVLAGSGADASQTLRLHEDEIAHVKPLLAFARRQRAVIAGTCGAAWLLAGAGLLDGKRATIAWWLKSDARRRFPRVRWEPSRMVVRQGRLYTSGGGFSGLDLLTTLLVDLGFAKEERLVRKLMVLPPSRQSQSPYEISAARSVDPFASKLDEIVETRMEDLDLPSLAKSLGMSPRTLSRRLWDEFQTSPGKWMREKRIARARSLLEETNHSVSEVCSRVGYRDVTSFSRLFSRTTGMTPAEFRKHLRP